MSNSTHLGSSTQHCAVIGDPVTHSLSPLLHEAGYQALGLDFSYQKIPVLPAELGQFVSRLRGGEFRGVSVTIPHKVEIMPYLDDLDDDAAQIGAVNTVVYEAGKLRGFNTDWFGARQQMEPLMTDKEHGHALVIGAGGAARSVIYAMQSLGLSVTVCARSTEQAIKLGRHFGVDTVNWSALPEVLPEVQLIFNTTPLGMGEWVAETPIEARWLLPTQLVCDAVYTPVRTRLIREAEVAGCRTAPGYHMLLWQGIRQFELFTGQPAPISTMTAALLHHLGGE